MVSSDRPGPGSPLTPSIAASLAATAADGSLVGREGPSPVTQRAALALGDCVVELAAAPGLAALALTLDGTEARYAVHADALAGWAERGAQLLRLAPARDARECVTIRSPFLVDAEGRATIALEADVRVGTVAFALHVAGGAAPPVAPPPAATPSEPAPRPAPARGGEPEGQLFSVSGVDVAALVEAARGAAVVAREQRPDTGVRGRG